MAAPVLGTVGSRLYEQVEPLAFDDEANGYALAHVCEAIGRMADPIADLVEDDADGPGWSKLVDVARTPVEALPWLAMVAGVRLTLGGSETVAREEVERADGQKRGTPAAILRAARKNLTGGQSVFVYERDGADAYALRVVTLVSETPDPARTEGDVRRATPIGIVVDYDTISTMDLDYDTLRGTHRDYDEVESIFVNYDEVESNPSKR